MHALTTPHMEPDAFLRWCLTQEDRWELVDYQPTRMMTGASERHDLILVNALAAFHTRLRGSGCRPTTADIALRTAEGTRRRPDMMVICEPARGDRYETTSPKLVLEVLSPSNGELEGYLKLKEYEAVASLEHILVLDYRAAKGVIWSRGAERAWTVALVAGAEHPVPMPGLGFEIPLEEFYRDIVFEEDAPAA
jgi:Uma2 family endonuclease